MPQASVSTSDIIFLFAFGGLVLYIAARAAVDAVTTTADPAPGRMAWAHWMPIAWSALLATFMGHSEIGVGLALATSIANLGLVLGVLLCVAPDVESQNLRTAAWPFVVTATILLLLAGFSGTLTVYHAAMLLALGGCVWLVWVRPPKDPPPFAHVPRGSRARRAGSGFPVGPAGPDVHSAFAAAQAADAETSSAVAVATTEEELSTEAADSTDDHSASARRRYWRIQLILAIALGAIGGWIGYKAVIVADDRTRVATSGLISLAVLSPLLVLPLLGTGAVAAHHGKLGNVLATIVGVILMNLCLLLPLVVAVDHVRQFTLAYATGTRSVDALRETVRAVPYPLSVWRIDTVLLIVLGLMLVPVSLGRWRLGRIEGVALAFVYTAYLIASTALAIKL
jgi:Ca2+/Na+ antiporter